jgi:hypothetical protein
MNRLSTVVATAMLLGATSHVYAAPLTFDGITFPDGEKSFADEVFSFEFGDPEPTSNRDPSEALGPPDGPAFTLGRGGTITLQFTDNSLTGSDSADNDLHIFEVGPDVEDTFVSISTDGMDFLDVGKVFGSTSSIDIDPFLSTAGIDPFTRFSYVRLRDDPEEGQTSGTFVGADIDALGAITSAPPASTPVPIPGTLVLLASGLIGMRAMLRRRGSEAPAALGNLVSR